MQYLNFKPAPPLIATLQVLVMLICLYVLPTSMPRYAISSTNDYYLNDCVSNTVSSLGVPVGDGTYNGTYSSSYPGAQWYCNVMNFCGFPQNGQLADTTLCPLYNSTAGTPIPSNQNDAVCSNNATMLGQSCPVNNNLNTAVSSMSTQYTNEVTKDWSLVLSLLFNAFIMCQVKSYAQ